MIVALIVVLLDLAIFLGTIALIGGVIGYVVGTVEKRTGRSFPKWARETLREIRNLDERR